MRLQPEPVREPGQLRQEAGQGAVGVGALAGVHHQRQALVLEPGARTGDQVRDQLAGPGDAGHRAGPGQRAGPPALGPVLPEDHQARDVLQAGEVDDDVRRSPGDQRQHADAGGERVQDGDGAGCGDRIHRPVDHGGQRPVVVQRHDGPRRVGAQRVEPCLTEWGHEGTGSPGASGTGGSSAPRRSHWAIRQPSVRARSSRTGSPR